jgi:D-sedoheptulose 7-phosphate isomerase
MRGNFFWRYYENLNKILKDSDGKKLKKLTNLIHQQSKFNRRIIIAGNGGSASIAAHICVDFCKELSLKAINFNEANLITCFANDYGYENWLKKAIEKYYQKNDLIILISSSGSSKNILNAAKYANKKKIKLVTLSGFSKDNKLKKLGLLNLWCNSSSYNFVEMTHYIWLVSVVDLLKVNYGK